MNFVYKHNNINVLNIQKSIEFYEKALGLYVDKTKKGNGFELVFLSDRMSGHNIELTFLEDRKTPYNLGDNEIHLAFEAKDFEAAHALHEKMGCICYENPSMGIYFISDPDGYWIEIVPARTKLLKHIVFWKFCNEAEGMTRAEIMKEVRARLFALVPIIPEIKTIEIGENICVDGAAYDMALYMTFESEKALATYKNHPSHVAVSQFVKTVRTDRVAVDYYI